MFSLYYIRKNLTCFGFFQCILHTFFELINRLKVRLVLAGFKAHMGYSSSVQEERGLLGHRVYTIIILKLCEQKESNPVILSLINEE